MSLQSSENYSVSMFASLWDLYWCQGSVSGGVNTPVGSSTHVETGWAGTKDSGST